MRSVINYFAGGFLGDATNLQYTLAELIYFDVNLTQC